MSGVSVVIPTYGREGVLLETLQHLFDQEPGADEILVVDQTLRHEPETEKALRDWSERGRIRWIVLPEPSIPAAMNAGLRAATRPIVLFLDDDLVPAAGLIGAHARSYGPEAPGAVVGQVLQPGQVPLPGPLPPRVSRGLEEDLDFPFRSTDRVEVANVMAGNLSVRRSAALSVGGFDERFLGQAFRFETEFARRLRRAGLTILFEPSASIRHLQTPSGGLRRFGSHLRMLGPEASVGDYYFALLEGRGWERWRYVLRRLVRSFLTRFHARRPWWIPVKLIGEVRGLGLALKLLADRGVAR